MEAMQQSLNNLKDMFDRHMTEFQQDLQKASVAPPESISLVHLATEFTSFKGFVSEAFVTLQKQMDIFMKELDRMETNSRRKYLMFHGVPEQKNEEILELVIKTLKAKTQMPSVNRECISRCHRISKESGSKTRPILVKFRDISIRDKIWFNKVAFKGSSITVSEFLTKSRHETFVSARQRYGINKCWTKNGSIFLITPDGMWHSINAMEDLNKLLNAEAPVSSVPSTNKTAEDKLVRPKRPKIK